MADVPALRRAISVLRAIALSPHPISAGELSSDLDIPRSTVYDILTVLEELSVVRKRKNGYLLGPVGSGLGSAYLRSQPLLRAAAPAMRTLADAVDGCVQLSALRGAEVQVLAVDHGPNVVTCADWAGDRRPANTSAQGQAILSRMPKGDIEALFDAKEARALCEEITSIRLRGYALEHSAEESGIWTVAAPLHPQFGSTVAAISVVLPNARWSSSNETHAARAVKLTAKRLSDRLS